MEGSWVRNLSILQVQLGVSNVARIPILQLEARIVCTRWSQGSKTRVHSLVAVDLTYCPPRRKKNPSIRTFYNLISHSLPCLVLESTPHVSVQFRKYGQRHSYVKIQKEFRPPPRTDTCPSSPRDISANIFVNVVKEKEKPNTYFHHGHSECNVYTV